MYLLNSLMNLRYKEGTSISDHLNDFQGLRDQLSGMSIKFDDEVLGIATEYSTRLLGNFSGFNY